MKIAIPMADGQLAMHFGHCKQFALVEVDSIEGKATNTEMLTPPPHEPGVLPAWLHEQGANVILAGGMGQRAQNLFQQNDIKVVVGIQAGTTDQLVVDYLGGTLTGGANPCDH